MDDPAGVEVAHGHGHLLCYVHRLLHVERLRPDVQRSVKGMAFAIAVCSASTSEKKRKN